MNLVKAKKTLGSAICLAHGIYQARATMKDKSYTDNLIECRDILKEHLTSNGLRFNWDSDKNKFVLSRICMICDYVVANDKPLETAFRFFEHEFGIDTLALEN